MYETMPSISIDEDYKYDTPLYKFYEDKEKKSKSLSRK